MKKLPWKKGVWIPYAALLGITLFLCWLFVLRQGVFGSSIDWISQHSVLPDYFRKQFYETGDFFPEFALHIGGGQNIYHFAYYGLYSPLILPSYVLPFVKMSDYMMAVQILCLAASVMLIYYWLRQRGIPCKIAFGTAIIFLLAGPVIFHSYNQIMFVNYMPFLCMGFLGVDRYFRPSSCGRQGGLLTVSIFLMIMTSFYFSIGGMLALVLYGIYRYFETDKEIEGTGKKNRFRRRAGHFFTEGARFLIPFGAAVMMSGILLVPAALALTGRQGDGGTVDLARLLLPHISLDRFFYSPYGTGLTTLAVTALVSMLFFPEKQEKILAWSCMIILILPLSAYLLNGGLYIRDKVMIPFLPLLCYILAYYLWSVEQDKTGGARRESGKWIGAGAKLFPYIVTLSLIYLGREQGDAGKYWKLIFLDGIVMLICFVLCQFPAGVFSFSGLCKRRQMRHNDRKPDVLILIVVTVIFMAGYGAVLNTEAKRVVSREFYEEVTDPQVGIKMKETIENEDGFYRMEQSGTNRENAANLNRVHDMGQYLSSVYSSSYNKEYQEFRRKVFQLEEPFRNFLMQSAAQNPVYQKFMGIKYIIRNGEVEVNQNVSPIAYATDQIITEKAYKKLAFPYNQLALLDYAVADNAEGMGHTELPEYAPDMRKAVPAEIPFPRRISSEKDQSVRVMLPHSGGTMEKNTQKMEETGETVLFLQFRVENLKPSQDVAVWVEGVRNKLTDRNHFYYNDNTTFTYAVRLEEGQEDIEIKYGKGNYKISDVVCYVADLTENGRSTLDSRSTENDSSTENGRSTEGDSSTVNGASGSVGEKDSLYQSVFRVNKEKTKGNVISGRINVKKNGYFITTIPYDENFTVCIDGKETEKEKVNTAFLGSGISEGEHDIEITYHAPGVRAGRWISLAGLLLFCYILKKGRAGRKRNRKAYHGHTIYK